MPIRLAIPDDSRDLLKIYAQYIDTSITFEYVLPTEREFSNRISSVSSCYPYLVYEENNIITGYAYAHRHMEREAYQWNAELSVYIDQSFTRRGIGKKLYHTLIEILKLQGVKTVYGIVTIPNPKSEALHNSLGFQILGTFHNAGYKDEKWHDVTWFEKQIAEYNYAPQPIISIQSLQKEQLIEIITSFV